jgi:hypothetical protein
MYIGSCGGNGRCSGIGPSQAEHLMSRIY